MADPVSGPHAPAIRLLGRFDVARGSERFDASSFTRRRPLDLLTLLALAPGFSARRELVLERLWPDMRGSAPNNLHRALFDLRRVLGDEIARLEKGVLRLPAETRVDVVDFEDLVGKGDLSSLEGALALYRGDLCEEAGSSERRSSLRARFVDAGLALARGLADRAAVGRAVEVLRRILAVDDGAEEAHRFLIRLHVENGRLAEAEAQLQACAQALAGRGGPSAKTIAMLAIPGRSPDARGPDDGLLHLRRRLLGPAEPATVRGREAILRRLDEAMTTRTSVLLTGEPGVGKTRLAVEVARNASEQGAVLVSAVGLEFAGQMPYQPFVSAFADFLKRRGLPLTDSPFEGFSPTPGGAPQEDTLRLLTAVERWLCNLAGAAHVCLVLDDLQLFDESSLHLVHYLARGGRTEPLVLVLTCREEETAAATPLASLLTALHRERLCSRIAVPRLDLAATGEQIADLLGRPVQERLAEAVHRLSDGNPYFTEEVVLAEPESLGERPLTVPSDLAAAVMERVSRLPDDAAWLLSTAAVAGVRFDFDLARVASGLTMERALAALERCLAARLLDEDGEALRFRHALAREALYASISSPRRIDVHRRVAARLEAGSPEEVAGRAQAIAFHYRAARELGRALPHLVTAGRRAATRAGLREAIELFQQARELMATLGVPVSEGTFELLLGLGKMRLALSDLEGAQRDLEQAASLVRGEDGWRPSPGRRAEARRWGALALITSGDLAGASALLSAALEDLSTAPDDPEWPGVLYHVAQLCWHEGRHREAYETAERSLAAAERLGDRDAIAQGYEMLALACHSLGEWRSGADFEDRRQALGGGAMDVAQAFDAHL